ncbi:sulfatase-like hydrolase/transferase [Seonamhaeicola sp.]|uniref:sulfatase family protein n=1 Tax=Seonamhaeicola sp. TaxID=1912245 RepID=UPI0026318811|nr:sulfatase-like hydrolase/transferase [Seonamhaeicola sp.]
MTSVYKLTVLFCLFGVNMALVFGQQPNIIVIFADDLGYNDVGFTGATPIKTPNIDKLAESGVIFTDGYVTHPYCGPSRAGLMSGRYQARFGMESNPSYSPYDVDQGIPLDVRFFPEELQKKGYRTGIIGKWHLGAAPPQQPNNRGFDYFFGFLGGGHDYFTTDITASHYTKDGKRLAYSPVEGGYLPLQRNKLAENVNGYLTTVFSEDAVKFVEDSKNDAKPFFLYLAYNAPHGPLQAPKDIIDKYKHIEDKNRRVYAAMIDVMDQGIGLLIDALEKSGQRHNTMIYFLSDNGGVYPKRNYENEDWADNSPFRAGKGSTFDGGIRVPFILSWPAKIAAGTVYSNPVISLDIAATSLKVADKQSDLSQYDGKNLIPYVLGENTGLPHEALFWRGGNGRSFAVRTATEKLIGRSGKRLEVQYYSIDTDISENDNIIENKKKSAMKVAELWNAWNKKNVPNRHIQVGDYQKKRETKLKEIHEDYQSKTKPLYFIPKGLD